MGKALAMLRLADAELTAARDRPVAAGTPAAAGGPGETQGGRRRRLSLRAWAPSYFEDFEPDFWPAGYQR